jgi:hypothetical protein
MDHDGVQMSSAYIISKVIQSKGAWIFKDFRICVKKVDWIGQTLVEYSKRAWGIFGVQHATRKTVQSLAKAGTSNASPTLIWEGVIGQNREVWYVVLKVQVSP